MSKKSKEKALFEVFFPDKPRLLFILLGIEHECVLPHISFVIDKAFQNEGIFYYKVWEHDIPNTTNLYNSWFTDIMMKKGSNKVIVVVHDECMEDMGVIFDTRMQAFHSLYNYKIIEVEFRRPLRIYSEEHPFIPRKLKKKFNEIPWSFWEMFKIQLEHCLCDTYTGCLKTIKYIDYSDLDFQIKYSKTLE